MNEQLLKVYAEERARLAAGAHDGSTGEFERPVFGEGPLSPQLMLIGEAPGAEETRQGHPFVGKAGKNLDGLLALAGIVREDVFGRQVVLRPSPKSSRTR